MSTADEQSSKKCVPFPAALWGNDILSSPDDITHLPDREAVRVSALCTQLLAQRQKHPDKVALHWLDDQAEIIDSLTYDKLFQQALQLVHHMTHIYNIPRQEKVLLLFYPGLEFTVAAVACVLGGFVGVPVYPPDPSDKLKGLIKVETVLRVTPMRWCLTHDQFLMAKRWMNASSADFPQFSALVFR